MQATRKGLSGAPRGQPRSAAQMMWHFERVKVPGLPLRSIREPALPAGAAPAVPEPEEVIVEEPPLQSDDEEEESIPLLEPQPAG